MRISAVLIVKDEAPIIGDCLRSVAGFDEIIVVDTGSTDGTQDICRSMGATVYEDYYWNDNFAEARNHAISKATGDWILSIDADHVLKTPYEIVVSEAKRADRERALAAYVKTTSLQGGYHWRETLFKNDPAVFWVGAVHECLSVGATIYSGVEKVYGYSKNHHADPERNIRILKTRCDPRSPRTRFYLARECYERGQWEEAMQWVDAYLPNSVWQSEKCEALLVKARCLWQLQRGNEAREVCLECIRQNPAFKEALLFMGSMHYEPWRSRWRRLAEAADNEDVLFVRA